MSHLRFKLRVDALRVDSISSRDLRTRIELLDAELEQLVHDEEHVKADCYGAEKLTHIRCIEKERSEALDYKLRLNTELGTRNT